MRIETAATKDEIRGQIFPAMIEPDLERHRKAFVCTLTRSSFDFLNIQKLIIKLCSPACNRDTQQEEEHTQMQAFPNGFLTIPLVRMGCRNVAI